MRFFRTHSRICFTQPPSSILKLRLTNSSTREFHLDDQIRRRVPAKVNGVISAEWVRRRLS
jgi:hypothetical protein